MKFNIISLFPEFFKSPLEASLLGKAARSGVIGVDLMNPRDYTPYKHRKVDDTPYGGGAGMVMMVEPIALAVEAVKARDPESRVVLMSARGRLFDAAVAREYNDRYKSLTLICGHYEGVDERVALHVADESLRIGNFVLSGGEIPALTVIDALARRQPGFMGNAESLTHESFDDDVQTVIGLNTPTAGHVAADLDTSVHHRLSFEHPQYTRPEDWRGHKVPEVLLSGNHAKIAEWRKAESEKTIFG